MSNKENLQTNNTTINTNNTELSSILEAINNLPTSSGGGTGGSLSTIITSHYPTGDYDLIVNYDSGFIEDGATYLIGIAIDGTVSGDTSSEVTINYNSEMTEIYRQQMGLDDLEIYMGNSDIFQVFVAHKFQMSATLIVSLMSITFINEQTSMPTEVTIFKQPTL